TVGIPHAPGYAIDLDIHVEVEGTHFVDTQTGDVLTAQDVADRLRALGLEGQPLRVLGCELRRLKPDGTPVTLGQELADAHGGDILAADKNVFISGNRLIVADRWLPSGRYVDRGEWGPITPSGNSG